MTLDLISTCFRSGFILFALLALLGCSGGEDRWTASRPQRVPVSGNVLYNGEPLAGAIIALRPTTDGPPAYGQTDEDGHFTLTTFEQGDGTVPGEHLVRVSKVKLIPPAGAKNPDVSVYLTPDEKHLIPEDYASFETSGLTLTVPDDGTSEVVFELAGEAP